MQVVVRGGTENEHCDWWQLEWMYTPDTNGYNRDTNASNDIKCTRKAHISLHTSIAFYCIIRIPYCPSHSSHLSKCLLDYLSGMDRPETNHGEPPPYPIGCACRRNHRVSRPWQIRWNIEWCVGGKEGPRWKLVDFMRWFHDLFTFHWHGWPKKPWGFRKITPQAAASMPALYQDHRPQRCKQLTASTPRAPLENQQPKIYISQVNIKFQHQIPTLSTPSTPSTPIRATKTFPPLGALAKTRKLGLGAPICAAP